LKQQFDAQRFEFVDARRAGKPAVDRAEVPFRRPRSDFG
jgi:hypothetical protein